MFGLEQFITTYLGESKAIVMLTVATLLILVNLSITMAIEIKKKDLHMNDVSHLILPIVLYGLFFFTLEAMTVLSKEIPFAHTLFYGVQTLGLVTALAKYGKEIYVKLKELGMPSDERIDGAFEEKLNSVSTENKEQIYELLDEYFNEKKRKEESAG